MLGLILPKAHLLEMTRKLAQRQTGPTSDGMLAPCLLLCFVLTAMVGYIIASLELAHEYATLGRHRRATSIFNQALDTVRNGQTSEEVAVRFLLRFAESLALTEDVPKRLVVLTCDICILSTSWSSSKFYIEAMELSNRLALEQNAKSTHQRIHARASVLEIAATATHVFALIQYAKVREIVFIMYQF